ncbi:MAG: hypothetical protein JJE01_09025 [Gemmatimonadetes bacterium]|nr:hypothetical protein [Gemmatimonadota bacterium]
MNRIPAALVALVFALVTLPASALAQDTLAGEWDLVIDVGQQIPLVLQLVETDEGFDGKYDAPSQGGFDLEIVAITAEHPEFKIELFTGGPPAVLEGTHDGDKLSGKFTQATAEGTFTGARKVEEKAAEGEGGR